MHDRQSDAVATPALRELFTEGLQKYHIIFFSAPCGFGKTTTASLLLEDHTVCEHSALHPDTLKQQIGNSCDTVLIDDLQLLREEEDQQILCRRINEYPGLHFILLSRGVLPGYLIPYQLTGALMSIESEQLRFDSDTTAELLLRGGIRPTAEELHGDC